MSRRSLAALVVVVAAVFAALVLAVRRGRPARAEAPPPPASAPVVAEASRRPAPVAARAAPRPAPSAFDVVTAQPPPPSVAGRGLRSAVGAIAKSAASRPGGGRAVAVRPPVQDDRLVTRGAAYSNWLGAAAVR